MPDTEPQRIGRYAVERRLGVGGMGTVYLGRSPGGLRVAIKVVRPELAADPRFRARFRREIEAVGAIGPLYTAQIIDADPDAEAPWFAATFLDGESLQERVDRAGPLGAGEVRALAAGLAEALVAVHAAGLVHRDLKPSNVLLTADGPRLIDFGIVVLPEASALTVGYIGTVAYSSPEHFDSKLMGAPSDVYALGATLYFAATGRGPHGEGTVLELMGRIVHGRVDLTGLPADLFPLVGACMRLDRAARPTAAAVLESLTSTEPAATTTVPLTAATTVPVTAPMGSATAAAAPVGGTRPDTSTVPAPRPAAGPAAVPERPRRWPWLAVPALVAAVLVAASLAVPGVRHTLFPRRATTGAVVATSHPVTNHATLPATPIAATTASPVIPEPSAEPGALGNLRLHPGTLSCHWVRTRPRVGAPPQNFLIVQDRFDWFGRALPADASVSQTLGGSYTAPNGQYDAGYYPVRWGRTTYTFLALTGGERNGPGSYTLLFSVFTAKGKLIPETNRIDNTLKILVTFPDRPTPLAGTLDNHPPPLAAGPVACSAQP